jgi:hypothetical protein
MSDERLRLIVLDSFRHKPPGHNVASRRLEQIARAQAETLHEQRMRKTCADMADLIEHAKQGEFREPSE